MKLGAMLVSCLLFAACGDAGGSSGGKGGAGGQSGAPAQGSTGGVGPGGCVTNADSAKTTCVDGVVTWSTNCLSEVTMHCQYGCRVAEIPGYGDDSPCNDGPDAGDAGGHEASPAACTADQFAQDVKGGACDGQEGATCGDGCATCTCSQNKWSCSAPACVLTCPTTAPHEGDPCGGCCTGVPCTYPCGGPGSASMATWSCVHEFGSSVDGTWHSSACSNI
jgi:hypothetical protein